MSRFFRQKPGLTTSLLAVLTVCVLFLMMSLTAHAPLVFPILLAQRLAFVACAAIVLGLAVVGGMALVRLIARDLQLGEAICFGGAVGLGWMALSTLAFGLWGFVGRGAALITLAVLLGAAFFEIRHFLTRLKAHLRRPAKWKHFDHFLWFFIALLPMLGVLCTFLPPLDYDVVEYHLGAPSIHFQQGHITYLPNLVYSNFPFNMEMLYLFSMSLLGSPLLGAYLAKLLNLGIACLLGLGIYSFAGRFFDKLTGRIALALFASCPIIFVLACLKAYVTVGWTFFTFLAFYALVAYLEEGRGTSLKAVKRCLQWLCLCGIASGLAAGCKYPAFAFVLVPFAIVILARDVWQGRALVGLKRVVLYGGLAVLLVSPWLIKNYVATRNPVYPLLYSVFGARNWSPERNVCWVEAHSPESISPMHFAKKFKDVALHTRRVRELAPVELSISVWILALLPAALIALANRERTSIYLVTYLVFGYLSWFFLTHQIVRFLVPYFPFALLVSARGLGVLSRQRMGWLLKAAVAVVIIFGTMTVAVMYVLPVSTLDLRKPEHVLSEMYPVYEAIVFAEEELTPEERMLAIGEARAFYFGRNFLFASVFDVNPLEELLESSPDSTDVAQQLVQRGIRYLFVNYPELWRLQKTYQFDYEGPQWGYSERIRPELFGKLEARGLIEQVESFGPPFAAVIELKSTGRFMRFNEPHSYVIYRIRAGD